VVAEVERALVLAAQYRRLERLRFTRLALGIEQPVAEVAVATRRRVRVHRCAAALPRERLTPNHLVDEVALGAPLLLRNNSRTHLNPFGFVEGTLASGSAPAPGAASAQATYNSGDTHPNRRNGRGRRRTPRSSG
jgi:hypothetical protein